MNLPVLLDCDGVLADFLGTVLPLIESTKRPADITAWDLRESLSAPEHRRLTDLLSTSTTVAASMRVMPGAEDGVSRLRRAGLGVVVVTSPWTSNPTWEHQRRAWLRATFGIKPDEIISTSAKHLVRGACFVDDKSDTVLRWVAAQSRPAFLFDAPYNGPTTNAEIHRRVSWNDVDAIVRAARWPG